MSYFPISFSELEKEYKEHNADFSVGHWELTCSNEGSHKVFSALIADNAMSVFGYKNTLFVCVSRYGIDVGVNKDPYKHNKLYYGEHHDLKEKYIAFSGECLEHLYLTIYDRSGKPLCKWDFKKAYVHSPQEQVFDMSNTRSSIEAEYLWIPIEIVSGFLNQAINLTNKKPDA